MSSSLYSVRQFISAAGITLSAAFSPQVLGAQQSIQSEVQSLMYGSQENTCERSELGEKPFPECFQIFISPGDTQTDVLNLMEHNLISRGSPFLGSFQDFDALQKDYFLESFLGPDALNGGLQAGASYTIYFSGVETHIKHIADLKYLPTLRQLSPEHEELFDLFTGTNAWKEILSFIIINESYINIPDFQSEGMEGIIGLNELWGRIGRKGQKEVYIFLSEHNLLPFLASTLDGYVDIPTKDPSSFGDFQIRFSNLYGTSAFEQWPTKYHISQALGLILDPGSPFSTLIAQKRSLYPRDVEGDIRLVEEIRAELQNETPDGRKVAILLESIFQTNDVRNIHIVGQIIALSLLSEKLQEHSNNLREQMIRSGMSFDITDPVLRERYAKGVLLINNTGEADVLATFFENYLRRIFVYFQDRYPERNIILPPETRSSEGVTGGKALYSMEYLQEDLSIYRNQLSKIPELSALSNDFLALENEKIGSSLIYDFLRSSEIPVLSAQLGLDTSLLPTEEELYARAIFGYANEKHLEQRMVEPTRKLSDFRGLGFAFIFGGYMFLSILGGVGNMGYKIIISPTLEVLKGVSKILFKMMILFGKRMKNHKIQK